MIFLIICGCEIGLDQYRFTIDQKSKNLVELSSVTNGAEGFFYYLHNSLRGYLSNQNLTIRDKEVIEFALQYWKSGSYKNIDLILEVYIKY